MVEYLQKLLASGDAFTVRVNGLGVPRSVYAVDGTGIVLSNDDEGQGIVSVCVPWGAITTLPVELV